MKIDVECGLLKRKNENIRQPFVQEMCFTFYFVFCIVQGASLTVQEKKHNQKTPDEVADWKMGTTRFMQPPSSEEGVAG